MNDLIQKGTYTIYCSECKRVLFGSAEGSIEEAYEKRNQMIKEGVRCPNGCGVGFNIEYNPEIRQPKYDAEHPYYESIID